MAQLLITLTVSLSILTVASAARILLIHPYFSKSHAVFNDAIANSLLETGHQVTAITCFPESIIHENYTAIDASFSDPSNDTNIFDMSEFLRLSNSLNLIDLMLVSSVKKCSQTIQLNEVQEMLKSKEKPIDLLMVDIFAYMFECFLPIADQFHVPVIGTIATRSWRYTEWIIGNPYNPAVIPFELSYNSVKMTFFQRMNNLWDCFIDHIYLNYVIYPKVEEFYHQWFPDIPVSWRKIPSLLFVNGLTVLNPRPLLPTVINVGGIHVKQEKPLPKNLQKFIDEADHGVILFSIGSVAKSHTMPITALSIFREVFAEIPQRVIWKAEKKIESLSDNVLLSKWLPQRDILAHKNVVAFISHSGISGTYEALYSGVPIIAVPIFFDQMSNAAILHESGVGIQLDWKTMTKENLRQALNDVINGTKYKNRLKEISSLIQNELNMSRKSVTYWTEYVLRHNGTEHMETQSFNTPLYQNFLFDVLSVLLIISIASISLYYLLKLIFCFNPVQQLALSIHFKKHDQS